MKLSDTQRVILSEASQHPDRLAFPPERLPAGALQKVAQALLKHGLVAPVHRAAYQAQARWTVDGDSLLLQITDDGLRAIGVDLEEVAPVADTAPTGARYAAPQETPAAPAEANHAASVAPPRASLREAAAAVLAAWDDQANRDTDMIGALEMPLALLRAALAGKPPRAPRDPGAPRKSREGTKQGAVLAMLRRPEGATVAQIAEAMAWEQHTVRGFFAGLKKKGITVVAAERIRQVGPNKEGAKGSYTIYRVEG